MTAWWNLGLVVVLAGACAAPERSSPRLGVGDGFVGVTDAPYGRGSVSRSSVVPAREIATPPSLRSRGSSSSAGPARPRGRHRVNVDLKDAPFDEAARFLANAGQFDLALSTPDVGNVTVSLKGVDPFEALLLLAETKRLDVVFSRGVAMVSGRATNEQEARPAEGALSE